MCRGLIGTVRLDIRKRTFIRRFGSIISEFFTVDHCNTRPALLKTSLGFWVFLPRQSNRYRSIHCVCQIKTAMLQKVFPKIFRTKMIHPTPLVNLKSEHKEPMRLLKVSRNERLPTNKRFAPSRTHVSLREFRYLTLT